MNTSGNTEYPADDRIENIIHGLRSPVSVKGRPSVRWTLSERMQHYHVPGISLAIIDDRHIVWAGGFGVKKVGNSEPVDTSTLFQAASISKPVTATAALGLVDTGKLSLDEDVNRYLRSWKLPENEFTVQETVTLRRILSHSAGLTVHGFDGYSRGQEIPTLQQILDGEKPANSPAIRVDIIPGSQWRYSGGGYTVLQQLLIDVLGESFPGIMKRMVLGPAGMSSSTFEQPLPASRHREAAAGHDVNGNGIDGDRHVYPEMAAAGLWTAPVDLAEWAIEITNAWSGQTGNLLSPSMAEQMMTVQKSPSGLGVFLEGEGKGMNFSHSGGNEGYQSQVMMYPAAGKGAAIMTNSDLGIYLVREILPGIAAEYDWPGSKQTEIDEVTLENGQIEGTTGTYMVTGQPFTLSFEITRKDDRLFVSNSSTSLMTEIHAVGGNEFISANGQNITFSRDEQGRAMMLETGGLEAVRK